MHLTFVHQAASLLAVADVGSPLHNGPGTDQNVHLEELSGEEHGELTNLKHKMISHVTVTQTLF